MQREKDNNTMCIAGGVLWVLAMVVATLYDLEISLLLYHPKNALAVFMEAFGFYPLYIPVILWVALWGRNMQRPMWQRVLAGFVAIAGCVGLSVYSWSKLIYRGALFANMRAAIVCLLLMGLCDIVIRQAQKHGIIEKLKLVFAFSTVYMLLNNIIIDLFKAIWARTRFDELLEQGGFENFTDWFMPFANGGSSFPSGHTAAACGIFVVLLLCEVLDETPQNHRVVCALCWLYIIGMAFGRIVIGRHYLSDTLMAILLATVLFIVMRGSKYYQAALKKISEKT